jgi:hypothetical protein
MAADSDQPGTRRLRELRAQALAKGEGLTRTQHTDAAARRILQAHGAYQAKGSVVEAYAPEARALSLDEAARLIATPSPPAAAGSHANDDGFTMPQLRNLLEALKL